MLKTEEDEVVILHLSDLHFGIGNSVKIPQERKDHTIEALRLLKEKLVNSPSDWQPHIIAISGDIGWAGKKEDYEKAWVWLQDILLSLQLTSDRLILCAGNHDRNRKHPKAIQTPTDEKGEIQPDKADEMLAINELEERSIPFEQFITFCAEHKIPPLLLNEKLNHLVGIHELLGLHFIILNSAWFTERIGFSERGKLFIGQTHIRNLSNEGKLVKTHSYDTSPITIALFHHPPKWLHDSETESYRGRTSTYDYLAEKTHIILCGHTHGEVLKKPERKYNRALLFQVGATAESQPYKTNCQLVKISQNTRLLWRLKLYYEPAEIPPRWRSEYDQESPYELFSVQKRVEDHLKLAKQFNHELSQLIEEKKLLQGDIITERELTQQLRIVCDKQIRVNVELLADFIPEQLPGIERGYPYISRGKIKPKTLQKIKKHIEDINLFQPNGTPSSICFNIRTDWLSQRFCFLTGNFWFYIGDYKRAYLHYELLESIRAIIHPKTREKAFLNYVLYFNKGVVLYFNEKYLEALQALEKANKRKKDNPGTLNNIALVLLELNRYEEALQYIEKALKIKPDSPLILSNKGIVLSKLKRSEDALLAFDRALKGVPNSFEILTNKGNEYLKLEEFNQAIKAYDEAIRINPDYCEAWYQKGNSLTKLGQYRKAIESYNQALRLEPKNHEVLCNKGFATSEFGDIKTALSIYNEALKIKEDNPRLLNNIGMAWLELGKNSKALTYFTKALIIKPNYPEIISNKGVALSNLDKHSEALKAYNQALFHNPNYLEALYNKGETLTSLGRLDEAIDAYNKVLLIDSQYIKAYYNKGNILTQLGKLKQAIQAYNRAIAINPSYAEAYGNRGVVYSLQNKSHLALQDYYRAIEKKPNYPEAWFNIGNNLKKQNELIKALEAYNKALEYEPKYLDALCNKGNLLIELGQLKKALKTFDKALEIDPNYLTVLGNKGALLLQMERFDEALEVLNRALKINPDHLVIQFNKESVLQRIKADK